KRWSAKLTRSSRADSKVFSKFSFVVMSNNVISPYQKIFEMSQSLSCRYQKL
ncbi:hypothetical protein DBR06_SOUSAS18010048, partial [Sousa chinensis]